MGVIFMPRHNALRTAVVSAVRTDSGLTVSIRMSIRPTVLMEIFGNGV